MASVPTHYVATYYFNPRTKQFQTMPAVAVKYSPYTKITFPSLKDIEAKHTSGNVVVDFPIGATLTVPVNGVIAGYPIPKRYTVPYSKDIPSSDVNAANLFFSKGTVPQKWYGSTPIVTPTVVVKKPVSLTQSSIDKLKTPPTPLESALKKSVGTTVIATNKVSQVAKPTAAAAPVAKAVSNVQGFRVRDDGDSGIPSGSGGGKTTATTAIPTTRTQSAVEAQQPAALNDPDFVAWLKAKGMKPESLDIADVTMQYAQYQAAKNQVPAPQTTQQAEMSPYVWIALIGVLVFIVPKMMKRQ
jgi:hypothetical protein